MNGLGERIRQNRQRCGMGQEEFAEKMGVSRQSVSKWENGMAQPEVDRLIKMCEIFDVTMDSLVRGMEPVSEDNDNRTDTDSMKTNAYAEKANAEIQPAMKKVISQTQRNWGIGLCCAAAVVFLLFMILGGIRSGLLYSAVFLVPGIYCLTIRRYLGLWIGWTFFVFLDVFLATSTSGSRGLLLAVIRNPEILSIINPISLVISILINIHLLLIVICSLLAFRHMILPRTKKEILLTLLPLVARFLCKLPAWLRNVSLQNENLSFFVVENFVLSWLSIFFFTLFLIRVAALVRRKNP